MKDNMWKTNIPTIKLSCLLKHKKMQWEDFEQLLYVSQLCVPGSPSTPVPMRMISGSEQKPLAVWPLCFPRKDQLANIMWATRQNWDVCRNSTVTVDWGQVWKYEAENKTNK